MRFEPEIHTKEYLKKDTGTLYALSKNSPEFAKSSLACDLELLSIEISEHDADQYVEITRIAHVLAEHNIAWLENKAVENYDVLELRDCLGRTVAHELASYQITWATHPTTKSIEILSLVSEFADETVAASLVQHNPEWVSTLTLEDMEIFLLRTGANDSETIAEACVNTHPTMISSEVLNSMDFLCIPVTRFGFDSHGQHSRSREFLAHTIAAKIPRWVDSDAAKNLDVLMLNSSGRVSVAHTLLEHQPKWSQSKEASMDKVLRQTDSNGMAVAHMIAFSDVKSNSKRIWAPEFLVLRRNTDNWQGRSVAHELAEHCGDWVQNSDEAYKKEILLMTAKQLSPHVSEGLSVSVAELMNGLSLQEIALRVISTGAAFKISGRHSDYIRRIGGKPLNQQIFEAITQGTSDLVDRAIDSRVKLKLQAACYSTLVHFYSNITNVMKRASSYRSHLPSTLKVSCANEIEKSEIAIRDMLKIHPELHHDLSLIEDINCEPSSKMISRLAAEVGAHQILRTDNEGAPTVGRF